MLLKLALPTIVLAAWIATCEWEHANSRNRPLTLGEIEAHLRDTFSLSEIELADTADGQLEGHGRGENGRDWRFSISQSIEGRTVVAKWTRAKPQGQGENQIWTRFSNPRLSYLLIGFGCLMWIGKVIRSEAKVVSIPQPCG